MTSCIFFDFAIRLTEQNVSKSLFTCILDLTLIFCINGASMIFFFLNKNLWLINKPVLLESTKILVENKTCILVQIASN